MADYTKQGHKLQHMKELAFQCVTRFVVWTPEAGFQRGSESSVAILQIIAPTTQGHVVRALTAWLRAYDDDELVEQVSDVVQEAFGRLTELKPPTPSSAPAAQQGQTSN